MRDKLERRFPWTQVVGTYTPPFDLLCGVRYQLCGRIVQASKRIQSAPDSPMALRCRRDREWEQIVFLVSCPSSLFTLSECS